ncbi:hypothetical protein CVS27_20060 [Arthrobacter glacialis]|uniref:Uncharacterized protein n=1 Tax=Arthrobacter glacialis TaxID=1664 RepID=A0A2S3ZQX9_ARTGL|nr:hypothetical protein CVS27_20060 [Arthrobacter glacialis]
MAVDWSAYTLFPVLHAGRPSELTRSEARANFKHELSIKEERKKILAELTARNGIVLEDSYECYAKLNLWFRDNIAPEPGDEKNLLVEWVSFLCDLNLYLGDALIARYPWLRWTFYTTSQKSQNYQTGVLKGYKVCPRMNVRFDRTIIGCGYVYLNKPEASPTVFVRQFVYAEDITIEQREALLLKQLGPGWDHPA